ncbi:UV DNA damage repair endonuclease UvsE [Candidatus Micrarchaeota archaeon]|nr:UV DNA damage repair endonuclease UvsE [Candidatus Micrarchaeota archaeon]
MRIGYPCINLGLNCTPNKTFRLANYSNETLIRKIEENLECLKKTLEFNFENKLMFFRIGSGLVPFASHPICKFNWQDYFKKEFENIGKYIKKNKIRISMHPDQFVLINALDKKIVERSVAELEYHCKILDLMKLNKTAKIQMHVGGVYGDRETSIKRFISEYEKLPPNIKKRLVVENDDRSYSLKDCLMISNDIGIPVVFDVFHHSCINNHEPVKQAIEMASKTWKKSDGVLMVDYSTQKINGRRCSHTEHIDIKHFKNFLKQTRGLDFDIMLEIKDKEKSALKAIKYV